jgi:hypothetical protein
MIASWILRDLDSFDYVVLVDDDHEFVSMNFETMIHDLEERCACGLPDVPLLGWYLVRSKNGEDLRVSVKRSPVGPYWLGGLGFCGMSRECFRTIHHPAGDDWVCVREDLPLIRGVYRSGPDGHYWLSEDLSFCKDSRPQLSVATMVEHSGFFPTSRCTLLDGSPLTVHMSLEVAEFAESCRGAADLDSRKRSRNALKSARRARSR